METGKDQTVGHADSGTDTGDLAIGGDRKLLPTVSGTLSSIPILWALLWVAFHYVYYTVHVKLAGVDCCYLQ